jgi:hypothetical protein
MAGTDCMNQNLYAYKIATKRQNWWLPHFTWLIDANVRNAWIFSKQHEKSYDLLEFRR